MNSEAVITRLMKEHGDSILRLCALYLRDSILAEDAAQETFLRAYRAIDRFRCDSSPKTWLTRIAINVCKDMSHKRSRQPLIFEKLPERADDSFSSDDSVLDEVMQLPVKYRTVTLLRYYQELDISEIAQVLGITRNAASVRLNRAREMLRLRLKTWYFDDP